MIHSDGRVLFLFEEFYYVNIIEESGKRLNTSVKYKYIVESCEEGGSGLRNRFCNSVTSFDFSETSRSTREVFSPYYRPQLSKHPGNLVNVKSSWR